MYQLCMARQAFVVLALVASAVANGACAGHTRYSTVASSAPLASRVLDMRTLDAHSFAQDPQRPLVDYISRYWPLLTISASPTQGASTREIDQVGVFATSGAYLGGLDAIRTMPAAWVARIRRLTPSEEETAFGRRHPRGALVIDWVKS